MSRRAGEALRTQWALEARRAAIMADPVLRAAYLEDTARLGRRHRTLERYGRLLREAYSRGELDLEALFQRFADAEERTYDTVHRAREAGPL